jgi:hypothetical protein
MAGALQIHSDVPGARTHLSERSAVSQRAGYTRPASARTRAVALHRDQLQVAAEVARVLRSVGREQALLLAAHEELTRRASGKP